MKFVRALVLENPAMDALTADRIHFAFTIMFHYLFPELTMGLALLIVILKTIALRTANDAYNAASHFRAHICAINFVMGVVLEFLGNFRPSGQGFRKQRVVSLVKRWRRGVPFFLEWSFLSLFHLAKNDWAAA